VTARFAIVALALIAAPAFAQPTQDALRLGYEGDDLYARGNWALAYDKFSAANERVHSPVFVLYMARCRKNAGRLLEARTIYERVARETLAPSAPAQFRDAISHGQGELAEISARIPSLRVSFVGATHVDLRIDGADAPTFTELDPGVHEVAAAANGTTVKREVVLREGSATVDIEIAFPVHHEDRGGSFAPSIVALSLGVAGVGLGAVTGSIALSKANALKDRCPDNHCMRSDASEIDTAKTLGTISTIGFIAGGVALAAGVVLFAVRRRAVRASISPISIDVAATF